MSATSRTTHDAGRDVLDDIAAAQQYVLDLQVLFYSLKTVATNGAKEAATKAAGPNPSRGATTLSHGDEADSRSSAPGAAERASGGSFMGPAADRNADAAAALQQRVEDLVRELDQERRERAQLQQQYDQASAMLRKSYGQIVDDYLFATEQLHERTRQLEQLMGAAAAPTVAPAAPDTAPAPGQLPRQNTQPQLSEPADPPAASQQGVVGDACWGGEGSVPAAGASRAEGITVNLPPGTAADGLHVDRVFACGVGDGKDTARAATGSGWTSSGGSSVGSRSATATALRTAAVNPPATSSAATSSTVRCAQAGQSACARQQAELDRPQSSLYNHDPVASSNAGSPVLTRTEALREEIRSATVSAAAKRPSVAAPLSGGHMEAATAAAGTGSLPPDVSRTDFGWAPPQEQQRRLQQHSAPAVPGAQQQSGDEAMTRHVGPAPRLRAHVVQSAVDSPPARTPIRPLGEDAAPASATAPLADIPSSPYCYDSPLLASVFGADSDASTPPPHYPPSATSACSLLSELAPFLSMDAPRLQRRAEDMADLPTRLFTSVSSPPPAGTTDYAAGSSKRGRVAGPAAASRPESGGAAAAAAAAPEAVAAQHRTIPRGEASGRDGTAEEPRRAAPQRRMAEDSAAEEQSAAVARGAQAAARAAAARVGAAGPGLSSLRNRPSGDAGSGSLLQQQQQGQEGTERGGILARDDGAWDDRRSTPSHIGKPGLFDSSSELAQQRPRGESAHRLRPSAAQPARGGGEPGAPAAASGSPGVKRPRRSDSSPEGQRSPGSNLGGRRDRGELGNAGGGEHGSPAKRGATNRRSSSGCPAQPVPPADPPGAYRPRVAMAAERLAAGAGGGAAVGPAGAGRGFRYLQSLQTPGTERAGPAAASVLPSEQAGAVPIAAAASRPAASASAATEGSAAAADVDRQGNDAADSWLSRTAGRGTADAGLDEQGAQAASASPNSNLGPHGSSGSARRGNPRGRNCKNDHDVAVDLDIDALFRMAEATLQRSFDASTPGASGPGSSGGGGRVSSHQARSGGSGGGDGTDSPSLRGHDAVYGAALRPTESGPSPLPATPTAGEYAAGSTPGSAAGDAAPRSAGGSTVCSSSSLEGLASLVKGLRQQLASMQRDFGAGGGGDIDGDDNNYDDEGWHTDDDEDGVLDAEAGGAGAEGEEGGYSSGEDGDFDVDKLLGRGYGVAGGSGRSGSGGAAPAREGEALRGWAAPPSEGEAPNDEEPSALKELRDYFHNRVDPYDSTGSGSSSAAGTPQRQDSGACATDRPVGEGGLGLGRAGDRKGQRAKDSPGVHMPPAGPVASASAPHRPGDGGGGRAPSRTAAHATGSAKAPLPTTQNYTAYAAGVDSSGELRSPPFARAATGPSVAGKPSPSSRRSAPPPGSQTRSPGPEAGAGGAAGWTQHDRVAAPDQTSPRKVSTGGQSAHDGAGSNPFSGAWKGTAPSAAGAKANAAAADVEGPHLPSAVASAGGLGRVASSHRAASGGRSNSQPTAFAVASAAAASAPAGDPAAANAATSGLSAGVRLEGTFARSAPRGGGAGAAPDAAAAAAGYQGLRSEAMFARIRQQLDQLQSSFTQGLSAGVATPGSGSVGTSGAGGAAQQPGAGSGLGVREQRGREQPAAAGGVTSRHGGPVGAAAGIATSGAGAVGGSGKGRGDGWTARRSGTSAEGEEERMRDEGPVRSGAKAECASGTPSTHGLLGSRLGGRGHDRYGAEGLYGMKAQTSSAPTWKPQGEANGIKPQGLDPHHAPGPQGFVLHGEGGA